MDYGLREAGAVSPLRVDVVTRSLTLWFPIGCPVGSAVRRFALAKCPRKFGRGFFAPKNERGLAIVVSPWDACRRSSSC